MHFLQLLACLSSVVFVHAYSQLEQPAPIHVAVNGKDGLGCGSTFSSACSSVYYAVTEIANFVAPLSAVALIVTGAGVFTCPSNSSIRVTRPLSIVGAGKYDTVLSFCGLPQYLTTNSTLAMAGMTLADGVAVSMASGLITSSSDVQLVDVRFTNHSTSTAFRFAAPVLLIETFRKATLVTLIGVDFDANVQISGVQIVENSLTFSVFTVLLDGCTFVNNTGAEGVYIGSSMGMGGISEANITLVDCSFRDNSFLEDVVEIDVLSSPSYVEVDGCEFVNNSASTAMWYLAYYTEAVNETADGAVGTLVVRNSLFANTTPSNTGGPNAAFKVTLLRPCLVPSGLNSSRASVMIFGSTFDGNSGGGASISFDGSSETGDPADCPIHLTITVEDSDFVRNDCMSALELVLSSVSGAPSSTLVLIRNCSLTDNVCRGGVLGFGGANGGGLVVSVQGGDKAVNSDYTCVDSAAPYREWDYGALTVIEDTLVANNTRSCAQCSGGGVAYGPSGMLMVVRTVIADNVAEMYGGGLFAGVPMAGWGSCCVVIVNSSIFANSVGIAGQGAQINNHCGGSFGFVNSVVGLESSQLEVLVPFGGDVETTGTFFQCPQGFQFVDAFHGAFGSGGLQVTGMPDPWGPCPYNVSAMQFGCVPCPVGTYTLEAGNSTGQPGQRNNITCFPCPFGGLCRGDGELVASVGYWGDGYPAVSFVSCPAGYCCDSEETCVSPSACAGHRTGALCGDCEVGYTTSFGANGCILESSCDHDQPVAWTLIVLGALVGAAAILYVADVWRPTASSPSTALRLTGYYFQMLAYVEIQHRQSRALVAFADVMTVLRLEVASSSSRSGMCLLRHLTATQERTLAAMFPFLVALLMALLVLLGMLASWCCVALALREKSPMAVLPGRSLAALELLQREPAHDADGDQYTAIDNDEDHFVDDARPLSLRARCVVAAIFWFLFAYSVFADATFSMLQCVKLPGCAAGDCQRLFIQGSVRCAYGGWQAGLILLAVVLGVVPVVLPYFATLAMRGTSEDARSLRNDVHLGFKRALIGSYQPRYFWWEAIPLLHRLVLALVSTFAVRLPVAQTVASQCLCALFLVANERARPMRDEGIQLLQTLFLLCLTASALFRGFEAFQAQVAFGGGGDYNASVDEIGSALESLTLAVGYVLPWVGVLVFSLRRYIPRLWYRPADGQEE